MSSRINVGLRGDRDRKGLMAFEVGRMKFGIDAECVVGALTPKPVTRVPGLPESFCGVLAYKNQLVPLIDPAKVLRVPEVRPARSYLLVSGFSRTVAIKLPGWPNFYRMGDLRKGVPGKLPLFFDRWIEDTFVCKGQRIMKLNLETVLLSSHWWKSDDEPARMSA